MLSKPSLRLFLVRHGSTDWNGEQRCLGRTDLPLSAKGRVAVQALAEAVDLSSITAVYSSPALRASETTHLLVKNPQIPVEYREELLEIKWPDIWEGLTWSEIAARYPEAYSAFTADPVFFAVGTSESLIEVQARMVCFYKAMLARHRDEAVLIVGHGCALQTLLCHLFHVNLRVVWPFDLRPASLSEVVIDPEYGPTLTCLSYTPRLELSGFLSRAEALR